jgi:hypothetical protein
MRRALLVSLIALVAAVPASADAPDPLPFSTHALVTDNADGSRTLTVYGGTDAQTDPAWHWPTNAKDCHLFRAGAGVAVAWNDPSDSGNELTGPLGSVGVGTGSDDIVHPTPQVDPAMPAAVDISDLSDWHDWRSGCGVFVNGVSQGTWGPFSHTYPASVTGALLACPVFYDVAGTPGGEPDTRNQVTAGGNPHNDDNSVESNAWDPTQPGCVTSNVQGADLVVDKQVAPEHGDAFADSINAESGDVVRYRFVVTNDGTVDLTGVVVNEITSIADCDPVADGFAGALPAGQTVVFTCTHTVGASTLVNVATASGWYLDGGETVGITSEPDSATVSVAPPKSAIAIDNAGPGSAFAGAELAYVLTVTNPGQQKLAEPVRVTDDQCDNDPVALLAKGGDLTPDALDPGDVWTYTCVGNTASGDTLAHNVANVEATDPHGNVVTATDAVDTALVPFNYPEQLVLGERIIPGRARLVAPTGCQAKEFRARVLVGNVATVTFVLDGKVIKRLTDVRSKVVSVRIDPQKLMIGIHRLTANVTFDPATRLKPKSLRVSFQRCARKLVAPRFTG